MTTFFDWGARRVIAGCFLAFAGILGVQPLHAGANGVPIANEDILAGATGGQILHYNPSGTLLDTLDNGLGNDYDTGMCVSPTSGNLFATDFGTDTVSEFDSNGNLVNATFGSGYNSDPESCQFNSSGDMFVGQADDSEEVLEFDPSGTLLNTFSPMPEARGTDWISLASDNCTLFYTSEGSGVHRFDVCDNTQLADFATGLPGPCFENAIRPNGEVMVACESAVVLLDTSGNIIQTYPASTYGGSSLFAMNLDPDGTSFWTADYDTGQINKIDIATGDDLQTIDTGGASVNGLLIKGAINVGADPPITASGDVSPITGAEGTALSSTQVATFTDPDTTAVAADYSASINWGDGTTSTTGAISGGSGSFSVSGNHAYAEEGSYTITTTITDVDNPGNNAQASSTANIADAALTASCDVPVPADLSYSDPTATFTDAASPSGTLSDFSATITWGDGAMSTGTISGADGGPYTVSGTHAYALPGPYTISTSVTDAGGAVASTGPCGATDARISLARATKRAGKVTFQWRMAISTGVIGFDVEAGGHQLNRRLIPIHRGHNYHYAAQSDSRGPFSLRMVLIHGQQTIPFSE